MTIEQIDLASWERSVQFQLFRTYDRPHFATTVRLSVSKLIQKDKKSRFSSYRACLFAIGTGIDNVPALRTRFSGDAVYCHGAVELSATVPKPEGGFGYSYISYHPDFSRFDTLAANEIERAQREDSPPNSGEPDDLVYLSCMPWLDYTSTNNAIANKDDCIPRVSWGKYVQDVDGIWRMPMTLEVHHAVVDGQHVGAFFEAVQNSLDTF